MEHKQKKVGKVLGLIIVGKYTIIYCNIVTYYT